MAPSDVILSSFGEGLQAFRRRFFSSFFTQSLVIACLIFVAKAVFQFQQHLSFYSGFFIAIVVLSVLQYYLFLQSTNHDFAIIDCKLIAKTNPAPSPTHLRPIAINDCKIMLP